MSDKEFASIVIRSLLALVSAICKKYGIPNPHNVTIVFADDEGTREPP